MASIYLDTSALGRVLLGEPGAPAILRAFADFDQRVASRLLRVELCRLGMRVGLLEQARQLLAGVALVPIDDALLEEAERMPPATVATLDAIHLATALTLAAAGLLDTVMTYDVRLADGARQHGLTVLAPG